MSFRDLDLKIGYDSDENDISNEFYKPVLKLAVQYDRLAGYFSSTTFAVAISETLDFIKNGGKMRLVTSTQVSNQDKQVFQDYVNGEKTGFEELLVEKINEKSDQIFRDCAALMGWMLDNKIDNESQLQIKIAIPESLDGKLDQNSIYHQKVGIFRDTDKNTISFEGSVNETGKAWFDNIEKFKVSTNWNDDSDRERISLDVKTFNKFWDNKAKRTTVIDLPTAVKEEFLRVRAKSTEEFNEIISKLKETLPRRKTLRLRGYQNEAINELEKNNFNGFFEMATGSGKTFAAFGSINRLLRKEKRVTIIIACPYTHLVSQWYDEFNRWNKLIEPSLSIDGFSKEMCFSDYPGWDGKLRKKIRNFNEEDIHGNHFLDKLLIFTTHDTLSRKKFRDLASTIDGPIFIIADEVHAVGSELRLGGLLENYQFRLGLSATPTRYFDDEGTLALKKYFGDTVYEFTLKDAIEHKFLVPYRYIPRVVELTDEEFEKYQELTVKIARKLGAMDGKEKSEELSFFIEGVRADVIASAVKKYDAFEDILDEIPKLEYALIYCNDKQMERAKNILFQRDVVFHQITYRESTEERRRILDLISKRVYDATLAIRCLDEGMDIPSAKLGILLASSGNPRQFIQRRGRLLRTKEGKTEAIIYDILVVPYLNREISKEVTELEQKIVRKELDRFQEFANSSQNKEESQKVIDEIKKIYNV